MGLEIKSADVPQANDLSKVIQTLVAINNGKTSDKEIAKVLKFSDRQGRYYRRAVEILGFVTNSRNKCEITQRGKDFLFALKESTNPLELLKPYLVEISVVREIMEYFSESPPVSPKVFLKALLEISELDTRDTTAKRRLSTLVNWMEQVGLLNKVDQKKGKTQLAFIPYVPQRTVPSQKILSLYDQFVGSILPYLPTAESESAEDISKEVTEFLNSPLDDLEKVVGKSEAHAKVGRLIVGVSEKDELSLELLKREIVALKTQTPTADRILLERYRALKGAATAILSGGTYLENMIEMWFKKHKVSYEKHYLFEGLSKNCDFYAEDIKLAIESKYSKTSGTKHGGAIKDLKEIGKAKEKDSNLTVGVAIAGTGFESEGFWNDLQQLNKSRSLDLIISPSDLNNYSPREIKKLKFPAKLKLEEIDLSEDVSSWSTEFTSEELGLMDAIFWLQKYSRVLFFNFESLLQNWISQTPFAIHCLRLILNWSESKMEGFIKASVPGAAGDWKEEMWAYESVSLLVRGLSSNLSENEKDKVKNFFKDAYSHADLVMSRHLGLAGWAQRKKDSSTYFIKLAKENIDPSIISDGISCELNGGTKLKANFSIKTDNGTLQVLCKYYSTSGSVMSDLVKTVEAICKSSEKDKWLLVTDGPGWLSRDKDLRRLLAIAKENKFNVVTHKMWGQLANSFKSPKKHIL